MIRLNRLSDLDKASGSMLSQIRSTSVTGLVEIKEAFTEPIDVPEYTETNFKIPSSSKALNAPTWKAPRAPPPERHNPSFFTLDLLVAKVILIIDFIDCPAAKTDIAIIKHARLTGSDSS